MSAKFTLGGRTYRGPNILARRVKEILFKRALNQKLTQADQELIVDLLKKGHPKADEKLGSGVKHVKVGVHPRHPGTRCFYVVRTDDTTADFSYRKCIESLFRVEKGSKKKTTKTTETGLVLKVNVEVTDKKRKREEHKAEEDEEDRVEDLNDDDDEENKPKRQKKDEAAKGYTMKPAVRIKRFFRRLGDVAYVEFDENNPDAGVTVRFKDTATVAKAQAALKTATEVPDLPGMKLTSPSLLTGKEEEEYYKRIAEGQNTSRKNRTECNQGQ